VRSIVALLVVLALAACGSVEPAPPPAPQSTPAPVPVPRESSVRPGINDSYLQQPNVEKWVQRFETEDREIWQRREEITRRVGLKSGMAVADVGAGTGVFIEPFSRAVGDGGKVYAVDILPEFLEHVRRRAEAAGLGNVETVLCAEDSVDLLEHSIDVAFVCDTYHHFEYPRSTLQSIHRALRQDGALVIVDFVREEGKSRQWVLEHVRAGKETVIREIQEAGFELSSEETFLKENYFLRFRRLDTTRRARSGRRRRAPVAVPASRPALAAA
jgi:ubiquinone/menaquinone biosynthesis C-methylase UbiE